MAKQLLREQIKHAIKSLSSEEKQRQSQRIVEKVLSHPDYKTARNVSVYLSTADEVDTLPILRDIFEQKKNVFVPTYNKDVMEMVQLRDLEDYETLPLTKWNIRQPRITDGRANALDAGLDLILLPGVAFDNSAARLGHGRGYYDKWLWRFFEQRPRTGTKAYGLAFSEQIVQNVPTTAYDFSLDGIISS